MSPQSKFHFRERGGRDNSATCTAQNSPAHYAASAYPGTSSTEAVQQQLDAMSQAVLDMWSTLRTVEVALGNVPTSCSPTTVPSVASLLGPSADSSGGSDGQSEVGTCDIHSLTPPDVVAAVCDRDVRTPHGVGAGVRDINSLTSPGPPSSTAIRLAAAPQVSHPKSIGLQAGTGTSGGFDSSAPLFGSTLAEVGIVLNAARLILESSPSVASVNISAGPAGTIANVSVKMVVNSPQIACASVAAIAKAALLESAASSKSVYVLGYESMPFHSDGHSIGFSSTLAVASCGSSTCWETFQKGCCPRGRKCKWQHPGRDEVQPIRVVFH